jgi:hypothetical protein
MITKRLQGFISISCFVGIMLTNVLSMKAQCPTNDPALDIINGIIPYTLHNVDEAWLCTCGDEDIKVAVIDVFNPILNDDLTGKIVELYEASPITGEWIECGHGTTTSGIIAAIPNNNMASAGIGYNTKVGAFNISGGCQGDSSVVFDAFQEAVTRGYKIINSTLIFDIQNEAQETILSEYLNEGGLLVVSGGNNAHAQYADWPGVINVGGMVSGINEGENIYKNIYEQDEEVAFDIFVSLEDMEGLQAFDQWGFTQNLLSENAAMVSATAALMLAVNDTLTGAEIEQIIKESGQGEVFDAPENSATNYLDIGAAVKGAAAFGVLDGVSENPHTLLTIYPNPASNYIIIDSDVNFVKVIDLSGNIREFFVKDRKVDISDLAVGLYYIHTDKGRIGQFVK